MRRAIALLLALCMVLCLCACGGKEEAGVRTGTVNGYKYENSFLGIGCELDESWTYSSKEELAQIVGLTAEMFDDDYAEKLKQQDMFYDMMAVTEEGLVSINVVIQNVGLLYGVAMSEDKYLDAAEETLVQELGSAGMDNVKTTRITKDFAGAEHTGLRISSTIQGVPYYCTQMCFKQGKYIATISLCSFSEDLGEELMSYFYAIGE